MVDNNNFEAINDNSSEENVVEKPYYENDSNNFNNNNQFQNQNIASAPIINPQSEWQTVTPPTETEQINNNNEQINPEEIMKKRRDKKNKIVLVLCIFLIGITFGSELAQIQLKLFSILILIDDLLVFAISVLTLCCLFINKNIYVCVIIIPSILITFGGAALKIFGMSKFLKFGTFMAIQFILLAVRSFGLFFVPFIICSEYGREA